MTRIERNGFVQVGLSLRRPVADKLDALATETGWTKAKTLEVALNHLDRCPDKQRLLLPPLEELLGPPR